MSSNSIIQNLTPANAISEISLLLFEPKHLIKTFIVVEGEDDCKLLASLLESDTILIESYGSKNDVFEIIGTLRKKRVIGIVDRDYDYSNYGKRIFSYDYSCAEMMIISDDKCMEKTLINVNCRDYTCYDNIRQSLLKAIEVQGYTRKMSYAKNWKIKFDGVKPSNYYHEDSLVRKIQLVSEINRKSPVEKITEERKAFIDGYIANPSLEYLLNIANGHDFIQLFCSQYAQNFSIKYVSGLFRSAFGIESFHRTNLYRALTEYQINKKLNICH